MLEIVFSESAAGSIKASRHFGKGKYTAGASSVILLKSDGSKPSEEEIQKAKEIAEAKRKAEWENAVPLGGKSCDVFCLNSFLSIGDISGMNYNEKRLDVIKLLFSAFADIMTDSEIQKMHENSVHSLKAALMRISKGEDARIWYSCNPDEMCGMHDFMHRIQALPARGRVYTVLLPEWTGDGDNAAISHSGWGDVNPSDWGRMASLMQEATPGFMARCADIWNCLKEENAPLRAYLNGRLQSVSEDIYDSFILREIGAFEGAFREAIVIGRVLGRYQLGISDAWISLRIEKMIESGLLEVVEKAPKEHPAYHKTLIRR